MRKTAAILVRGMTGGVGGSSILTEAMRMGGYSAQTADEQVGRLRRNETFLALLEHKLNDRRLVNRHAQLIKQDDNLSVAMDGIKTAYRLKGYLDSDNIGGGNVNFNFISGSEDKPDNDNMGPAIDVPGNGDPAPVSDQPI